MTALRIGYAAMLERFDPTEVVGFAAFAQANGFDGVMASDHFQPWLPTGGQSSFVWPVLSAIAAASHGDFGPGVTTPLFRMHPATVAQASATLAHMYPGRHWLGIGSGEAINEQVFTGSWPSPAERIDRMFEAVSLIRKLFAASVSDRPTRFDGTYFRLETTRLWTMPAVAPPVLVAAAGPATARRAGASADGFITTSVDRSRAASLLERFSEGARSAGRQPDEMCKVIQLHLSWAPTDEEAESNAVRFWPNPAFRQTRSDIRTPHEFEQLARMVRPDDLRSTMLMSSDLDAHRAYIQSFIDLGFNRIYIHNVNREQRAWITAFGEHIRPALRA